MIFIWTFNEYLLHFYDLIGYRSLSPRRAGVTGKILDRFLNKRQIFFRFLDIAYLYSDYLC